MKTVVGITGASGVIVGIRLIEELVKNNFSVDAIISKNGHAVIQHEIGNAYQLPVEARYFDENDALAPLNSSSYLIENMIIAPCSMKTLAALANGFSYNLIVRSAENQLRTGKPLIIAPRETPLSKANLENMLKIKNAGAIVCPLMAAYYHHPKSVSEMTNFFVGKILDSLGISNQLYKRWQEKPSS